MSKKTNWKFVLRLVISLLLFSWLLYSVEWCQVWNAILRINVSWLLLATGWVVTAIAVSVVKWRLILQSQGLQASWGELWRAYWIGLFFNNFLPSSIGGDTMRIVQIGKTTGDAAGVTASVVMERLLATIALSLVGLAASVHVFESGFIKVRMLFGVLLAGSLLLAGLLMWGKVPGWLARKNGKLAAFLHGFMKHGQQLRKQPMPLFWSLLWSVVFQMTNVAVNYSIFQGLGLLEVNLYRSMFIIPATAAVAMLPIAINGYGIREGAYVFLLAPYGVNQAAAFTASILFAFLVSLCSLWGSVLWLGTCNNGGCKNHAGKESV